MNNFNNTENNIMIEDHTQFPSITEAMKPHRSIPAPYPYKRSKSNNRKVVNYLFQGYYENPHKFKPIYEKETFPQLSPEELKKKKEYTQPCNHVINYGVCRKKECTFAHSFAELRLPECHFGKNCNCIHGKPNYHDPTVIDKNRKCRFKHPNESIEKYYKRINKELPLLPKTSECSKQPSTDPKKRLNLGEVDVMNRTIEYKYRKKDN